jgi:hypothetical protein
VYTCFCSYAPKMCNVTCYFGQSSHNIPKLKSYHPSNIFHNNLRVNIKGENSLFLSPNYCAWFTLKAS